MSKQMRKHFVSGLSKNEFLELPREGMMFETEHTYREMYEYARYRKFSSKGAVHPERVWVHSH